MSLDFDDLMIQLEEDLSPNIITGVVDTGESYVVSVCGADGYPILQAPYEVSRDGKISVYNIFDEQLRQKLENGKILYTDYSLLRMKPAALSDRNGKNIVNFTNPLDNSQNSDKIELGNPQSHMDGGPGSGNHGHKGVKGQRGGSAPNGNANSSGNSNSGNGSASTVSPEGENTACKGFASKAKLKSHARRHGSALGIKSEKAYQQKGIDFLKQSCGGDIIGYATSDGKVVRFNTRTTEYATGYPGDRLCTYMKPKAKRDGTANPEAAMNYYKQHKEESE